MLVRSVYLTYDCIYLTTKAEETCKWCKTNIIWRHFHRY